MARADHAPVGKASWQRRERRSSSLVPRARRPTVGRPTAGETPLHLRARGVEVDDGLRRHVHARAGVKLGKYVPRVTRIAVRLADVAGPAGAPACACRIEALLAGRGAVVVATEEPSARAAFDAALDATERAVRRLLERVRRTRRRRPTTPRALR